MTPAPGRRWFPFSIPEVEVSLAIYALSTSTLAFLGVEKRPLAWFTLGYLAFAYLAGLLVHARRPGFTLLRDGALRGAGYARFFRGATRSLLLLHTDDDSPSDELLGLYRTLLDRGIELRRIIFIRPDHAPGAYDWVHRFGRHERLQQRVILPDRADVIVEDEPLVLQHLRDAHLQFGRRNVDGGGLDAIGIANPRNHISNRVGHHTRITPRTPRIFGTLRLCSRILHGNRAIVQFPIHKSCFTSWPS